MAAWKIDTIKVEVGNPKFYLYNEVWVDDNGLISVRNVSGKQFFSPSPLSEFRSFQRNAPFPPLRITEFCNYTTFTKYLIYRQDTYPYAYTQQLLNEESCGYETVLPTPGVPYNPFGNPNYGNFATFSFCDNELKQTVVTIKKKNYEGSVWELPAIGGTPVIISRDAIKPLDAIAKTEAKITLVALENFEYSEFYTQDERMFQVEVVKDGIMEFKGYVLPDNSRERFDWPATEVQLTCTDGLTQLKEVTYPIPLGGSTADKQSFKDIILYCLAPLNLNLDLSTIVNIYATTNQMGLNDDPMSQNKVSPLRLVDEKGSALSSYEVLENLGKQFGAVLVQDGGKWIFFRRKELILGSTRMRTYNYEGLFLNAEEFTASRMIGGVLK